LKRESWKSASEKGDRLASHFASKSQARFGRFSHFHRNTLNFRIENQPSIMKSMNVKKIIDML